MKKKLENGLINLIKVKVEFQINLKIIQYIINL